MGMCWLDVWVHCACDCNLWISSLFRSHIAYQAQSRTENGGLPSAFPVSELFSLAGVGRSVVKVLPLLKLEAILYLWIDCIFLREWWDLLEERGPWGWGMAVTALFAPRLAERLGSLAGLASAQTELPLPSGTDPPLAPRPCRAGFWGREGKSELVGSCVVASEQHGRLGLLIVCPTRWLGTWALAAVVCFPTHTSSVFWQEFNELLL